MSLTVHMNDILPVGTRVLMMPGHPHEGKSGTIVRWETIGLFREEGPKPVIQFDDGMQAFAMKPTDFGVIPQAKQGRKKR